MSEAFGLTCWPSALVPESKLSHRSEAHHCCIMKLSHHEWKKTASLKKHLSRCQTGISGCAAGFLVFASADVFSCEATGDDGRAWAGACSQAQSHDINTQARRAEDIDRGVLEVFVLNRHRKALLQSEATKRNLNE